MKFKYSKAELEEIVPATNTPYRFRLEKARITVMFFRYGLFSNKYIYTTCHIQVEHEGKILNCWGNTVLNPHDTYNWQYAYRLAYKRAIDDMIIQYCFFNPTPFGNLCWKELEKKMRTKLFNLLVKDYETSKALQDATL